MKNLISVTTTLFFFSFLQACFGQQAINDSLKAIGDEFKAVGISVVVVKDGAPVFQTAVGSKNLETGEPLAVTDIFRIASISKSFSATAIMQLVEDGRLSLDADFGELIGFPVRNPKFPDTPITLRMVLSHTSSINDKNGYFNLDVINPEKNPNWRDAYNDYEPGKGYQYCNLNFNMVGAVLERQTGERFDSYIKRRVLDPLKLYGGYCVDSLDHSSFVTLYDYDTVSSRFIPQPTAYHPRRAELQTYKLGESTPVFSPTGGMKISAVDLAAYMIMHMNGGEYKGVRLIKPQSSATMQTPVAQGRNYGLALEKTDQILDGIDLVGHTGSAYGLHSAMFFHPKEHYGFVLVTNGCIPTYKNDYPLITTRIINFLYRNFIQ